MTDISTLMNQAANIGAENSLLIGLLCSIRNWVVYQPR